MHPAFGNRVVLTGLMAKDGTISIVDYPFISGIHNYIGHNLKFDFGYTSVYDRTSTESLISERAAVWDTQVAEYVNGNGMLSLERACHKHGVEFKKDDDIKAYWEQGVDTEDIPRAELEDYLKEDLRATQELARKQWEAYKNHQLIMDMSRVGLVLGWIEQEGMHVDEDALIAYAEGLYKEELELFDSIRDDLLSRGWPESVDFKPASAAHLSTLFFGGEVKVVERQCVGKYKNGKDKYKNVEVPVEVRAPKNKPAPPGKTATNKPRFDDQWWTQNKDNDLAAKMYRIRQINKEMSTFVDGVASNMTGGLLYGDFNNCVTATGRLSSSNPNLQNLTNKSPFKRVFTSRYEDGYLVEIDYSQLEMCILAALSGDPVLIKDIREGKDLHYETGKSVFGWKDPSEMNKDDRRTVKGVNFGLVYGGGAPTISKQTGAAEETVERLIEAFYKRYPGVREWQENSIRAVEEASEWRDARTSQGEPAKSSQLVSPLGRVWRFDQDNPPWGGRPNFPPTKIKNYPVQGFATGDLVPLAVMLVAEFITSACKVNRKVHLTCTVHDSILLDVGYRKEETMVITNRIIQIMQKGVSEHIKKYYGVELPVDLVAEAKIGKNWYDMEDIK